MIDEIVSSSSRRFRARKHDISLLFSFRVGEIDGTFCTNCKSASLIFPIPCRSLPFCTCAWHSLICDALSYFRYRNDVLFPSFPLGHHPTSLTHCPSLAMTHKHRGNVHEIPCQLDRSRSRSRSRSRFVRSRDRSRNGKLNRDLGNRRIDRFS
jgi:hypothetical protein